MVKAVPIIFQSNASNSAKALAVVTPPRSCLADGDITDEEGADRGELVIDDLRDVRFRIDHVPGLEQAGSFPGDPGEGAIRFFPAKSLRFTMIVLEDKKRLSGVEEDCGRQEEF